jgi:arginase family enzyme
MRLRIVDLDGNAAVTATAAECGESVQRIDCRDLGSRLRLWTTRKLMKAFASRLNAAGEPPGHGPTVTLLGSGDYHHLTAALLERMDEPFTLIHFDNHPDWVRLAPRHHCGSWVNRALALASVARVITIGPCSDDLSWPEIKGGNLAALGNGRLELYPWRREPTVAIRRLAASPCVRQHGRTLTWRNVGDDWSAFLDELHARLPTEAIWLTVDKDVLRPGDAGTNWDQGEMPLDALLQGIRRLSRGKRVLGADLCGDYSPPEFGGNLLKRLESWQDHAAEPDVTAHMRNVVANRAILGALKEVMA